MSDNKTIFEVAVGILFDESNNQILLTSRPKDKIYAGYWEFPGGKIELGEDACQALSRELNEELGVQISVDNALSLGNLSHKYPHGTVNLQILLVRSWKGDGPKSLESQKLYWYKLDEVISLDPLLPTTSQILTMVLSKLN